MRHLLKYVPCCAPSITSVPPNRRTFRSRTRRPYSTPRWRPPRVWIFFCVGLRSALSLSPAWESSPSRGSPLKSEHVRSEPVGRWAPLTETSSFRCRPKRAHWHLLVASSVSLYLGRLLDSSATRWDCPSFLTVALRFLPSLPP